MDIVLKLCKIPKYYEQDCPKKLLSLLSSLNMIQISKNQAILTQIRRTYQKWKSKARITSSNPPVRRLKAGAARLKAKVEAIKPRVK